MILAMLAPLITCRWTQLRRQQRQIELDGNSGPASCLDALQQTQLNARASTRSSSSWRACLKARTQCRPRSATLAYWPSISTQPTVRAVPARGSCERRSSKLDKLPENSPRRNYWQIGTHAHFPFHTPSAPRKHVSHERGVRLCLESSCTPCRCSSCTSCA